MSTRIKVNIKGLDKAEVLAAAFNSSKQQGMGFCDTRGGFDITKDEAEKIIKERNDSHKNAGYNYDYLRGRVLKISIDEDEIDPWGYDRDNGEGALERAVAPLRK